MSKTVLLTVFSLLFALLFSISCSTNVTDDQVLSDDEIPLNQEYGKPTLGQPITEGKGDSVNVKGIKAENNYYYSQVWEVKNQWEDTNTEQARKPGMAWGANSGLTWEEKYQKWVKSLPKTDSSGGYYTYDTFKVVTPYNKSLPAPLLECAESAMFLRIAFSAWYHLPFMMQSYDSGIGKVYFGHFGIRTASGRYKNSPNFKKYYQDYSNMTVAEYTENWPSDSKLKKRKLTTAGDDLNLFLCEDCYAGAYFDQIFLNKRVGHFLMWALTYMGSMHLASATNTFNITPKAIEEGDILLERWQKKGIGHTLIVKNVDHLDGGKLSAELASGSMPRRQPKWASSAQSKSNFTSEYCGGEGTNSDGDEYAKLGGGIKRFRHLEKINGYWYNVVPKEYQNVWLKNTDYEKLKKRPEQFENLLTSLTPEQKVTSLIQTIDENRLHLQAYPASCAARIEREKAFHELYKIMSENFGKTQKQVDKEYRIVDDYIFPELEYSKAKTCCWDSSTHDMYQIVMDYNLSQVLTGDNGCSEPAVFKAQNAGTDGDGYQIFKAYAESIGKADKWVAWSADESCPQAGVANDLETEHEWTTFCDVAPSLLGEGNDTCSDSFGENHSTSQAAEVTIGEYSDLKICSGSDDWYKFISDGTSHTVQIEFTNNDGDIDLYLFDQNIDQLTYSYTTNDIETVQIPATQGVYFIKINLYDSDSNVYNLSIQ